MYRHLGWFDDRCIAGSHSAYHGRNGQLKGIIPRSDDIGYAVRFRLNPGASQLVEQRCLYFSWFRQRADIFQRVIDIGNQETDFRTIGFHRGFIQILFECIHDMLLIVENQLP